MLTRLSGEPADNASSFFDWLQALKGNELAGVKYAVFGCGHKDWVKTYQRVPTLIDSLTEERGGIRLLPRGEGDSSSGEFFQSFDNFEAKLWEVLVKACALASTVWDISLKLFVGVSNVQSRYRQWRI